MYNLKILSVTLINSTYIYSIMVDAIVSFFKHEEKINEEELELKRDEIENNNQ